MKPSIDELVSTNPSFKVCFVNDGSTDLTSQKLKQLFPGQHCSHITNVGVSGALLSGFRAAMAMGADWAVQCDSDGQHPVEEIPRLVSLAQERSVDVLIGSRYLDPHYLHLNKRSSTPARRLGGICIGFFLRALFRARTVSDPTSGFRVYSVKAMEYFIRRMPDEYPEPEMIALAARGQLVVAEAGVCMSSRHSGESSLGGLRSVQFMVKVITALIGLKLRHLGGARRRFGEELSQ
jgi:glycosyltransferase involved in cell wall biosynthesis